MVASSAISISDSCGKLHYLFAILNDDYVDPNVLEHTGRCLLSFYKIQNVLTAIPEAKDDTLIVTKYPGLGHLATEPRLS